MNLISAENISQAYGDKILFDGLNFGIAQGQKVALIGINGSGKSSLLKIIAGIQAPDAGQISQRRGLQMSYLSQEPDLPADKTIGEVVFSADLPAMRVIREYEQLLKNPSADPDRMNALINEIEALGAWDYEHKIQQILTQLDVNLLDQPIGTLSGGQRKRVAIAQALIEEPEFLIMDEPTNHLDLPTIEWLEKFLSTSKQSLLLVTHDRYFLDAIANEIFELDNQRLYTYQGDYGYFLEKKSEREVHEETTREKAQRLYRGELEWLRRSPKARTTKSKSRIDAAHQLGEVAQNYRDTRQVQLAIQNRRIGGKVMEIKKLRKAYDDQKIVNDFTYTFNKNDRIGIAGPNGVGKTTFINMLLGQEPPDSGKIRVGETIHFGYYKQGGHTFKPNQRIIEVITEVADNVDYAVNGEKIPAGQLLEYFLFPYSTHYNRVETLSGGEKRRLHMLRVLIENPNFLVLDEPTNDLDLVTLRRLEEFLLHDYQGCLVIVSHDRYFMDRLVDHLFVFEGEGEIKDYPGSYSQYQRWKWEQEEKAEKEKEKKKAIAAPPPSEKPKKERKKNKLSFNEKREFEQLDEAIQELEARIAELQGLLGSGETDYQQLQEWTEGLQAAKSELEVKQDRWLELAMIEEGE
jgi:ATP-binding cassette subfamily F protein uup